MFEVSEAVQTVFHSSTLSLSTAIIIASIAGVITASLVVVLGQFLKPSPEPHLYNSVAEMSAPEKKDE